MRGSSPSATGKPYLIQSLVGDNAYAARNLYTYLLAQNAVFFPDAAADPAADARGRARSSISSARSPRQGTSTLNQDTPAAIASFMSGEGGIYPTGTWMIGQFEAEANTPGRPLYQSYTVYPYPRLWGERRQLCQRPRLGRAEARADARAARAPSPASSASSPSTISTGRGPATCRPSEAVVDSPAFQALPHRANIAPVATTGRPLPGGVQRQNAIEGLVGEEVAAAFNGQKPTKQALADAERRVNELLAQLP